MCGSRAHAWTLRILHAQPAADQRLRPAAAQPSGHPRPQAVARQAARLARRRPSTVGLALGGPGGAVPSRPRARLEPLRPIRPVRLVLVGREPRVALGLPTDRRGIAAGHQADPADAGAVADLDKITGMIIACFIQPNVMVIPDCN